VIGSEFVLGGLKRLQAIGDMQSYIALSTSGNVGLLYQFQPIWMFLPWITSDPSSGRDTPNAEQRFRAFVPGMPYLAPSSAP